MSGTCWIGLAADARIEVPGTFDAEIHVRDASVGRFELRFGDAELMREKKMLFDSGRFDVAGYDVIVRAEPIAGELPLEISKR
jgi:hypothetical protein